jgi:hypothetical protein
MAPKSHRSRIPTRNRYSAFGSKVSDSGSACRSRGKGREATDKVMPGGSNEERPRNPLRCRQSFLPPGSAKIDLRSKFKTRSWLFRGGEVRNRDYSITKILYEAKHRRRNSGAWGVARNTLIRFRLPYALTAAGLSPFDNPAPGRMKRTPAASPAISRNLAQARVIVNGEHPSCSAISGLDRGCSANLRRRRPR